MTAEPLHPESGARSAPDWARRWDVVVVGGRLAGASVAHAIAPWAEDVLVVDRCGPTTFWPQQVTWNEVTNEVWQDLGLLDTVVRCGAPALHAGTWRVLHVSSDHRAPASNDRDFRMSVAREVLDPALARRAAQNPGVRLLQPAKVLAPTMDGPRVSGVRIAHDGVVAEVAATLVVFADGRRSRIGAHLGLVEYESIPSPWMTLLSYHRGLPLEPDHVWQTRLPGSLLTVSPTGPGQWCVGTILHEEHIAASGLHPTALHRATIAADPVLGPAVAAGRPDSKVGGAGGLRMYRRPMTGPGWCLVGDSGLHLDPISAMGTRAALVSARLLRDRVAALGRIGADPGDYADLTRLRDAALANEWLATRRAIGVGDGDRGVPPQTRDLAADGEHLALVAATIAERLRR